MSSPACKGLAVEGSVRFGGMALGFRIWGRVPGNFEANPKHPPLTPESETLTLDPEPYRKL